MTSDGWSRHEPFKMSMVRRRDLRAPASIGPPQADAVCRRPARMGHDAATWLLTQEVRGHPLDIHALGRWSRSRMLGMVSVIDGSMCTKLHIGVWRFYASILHLVGRWSMD